MGVVERPSRIIKERLRADSFVKRPCGISQERLEADSHVVACVVSIHRLKPDGGIEVAGGVVSQASAADAHIAGASSIEQERVQTERGIVITGRVGLERVKADRGIRLALRIIIDLEGIVSQSGVETWVATTRRRVATTPADRRVPA